VLVEGDVAPSSWHPDLVSEVVTEEHIETPSGLLEGALLYRTVEQVRAAGIEMSVVDGKPVCQDPTALRALARPKIDEAMSLLANLTPGRRKWLEANMTWAPSE
jgi:hypothetical protein